MLMSKVKRTVPIKSANSSLVPFFLHKNWNIAILTYKGFTN